MLDAVANFAIATVSTGYSSSDTTIVLASGDGAVLPQTPPYNLVWWNATDYPTPALDPQKEIIRVTAINGDTLSILRGQEGTTAQNHNISGKVYKVMNTITAKMINDISTAISNYAQNHLAVDVFTTTNGQQTFTAQNGRTPVVTVLFIINGQPLTPVDDWTNPTSNTIQTTSSDYPAGLKAIWIYFY